MDETKDLQVHSIIGSCTVTVSEKDTLSDVRAIILERYREDILPPDSSDFIIFVGDKQAPIWRFKEERTNAWNVINNSKWGFITLKVFGDKNKRNSSSSGNESDDDEQPLQKKSKTVETSINSSSYSSQKPGSSENGSEETEAENHDMDMNNQKMPPQESKTHIMPLTKPAKVFSHVTYDKAISESTTVLEDLNKILHDTRNTMFCSEDHRKELSEEMKTLLNTNSHPDVIIGCLGATGVGKSSLLNALLDEADVLPTSGSRGCTAAVVELRFNRELLKAKEQTVVYQGQVEFISLQDWHAELKILLDECCVHDTQKIYASAPQEQNSPEAAASWAKINQVYGRGTMASFAGKPKSQAWESLSKDPHVASLLQGENEQANSIVVEEGTVNAEESKLLLSQLSGLKGKLRRAQKNWAKDFRDKINDYVYRKGNGREPQTWPLIRRVTLFGPWSILATGACLVDLPGVRDANAARARIAQNYLQNCHRIWVVAPIKRAVDDGTAKELLGENFKRQLLMDGQYGNVSFICSQTDDCETTEIMRDHEDVARKVEGRWERMVELRDEITDIVTKRNESAQQREDLTAELEEIQGEAEALTDELGQADTGRGKSLPQLKASLQAKKQEANVILTKLEAMKQGNLFQKLEDRSASLQRELKSMAALVRNEYSTKCLQDDFRAGLEELTCRPEEEEGLDIETTREGNIPSPLTEDFQLDVHCIASNDYLKLQGVKLASDGTSNTFDEANDTGIPSLRAAVHSTTAEHRASSAAIFVKTASSILERFILCSTENIEENASTYLYRQVFEKEIEILRSKIGPVAAEFTSKAQAKFSAALHPSLKNGAEKGTAAAMATVKSWWATCRRTKQKRSPKQNALHWATYNAVVRRDGFYVSPTFGEVDFNQELCDPMEKEFSIDWQRDMDGAVKVFLAESEQQVVQISIELAKNVAGALVEAGMDPKRVEALAATADQNCATAIQAAFQNVFQLACNSQRNLNRSLLPKIRGQMSPGYSAAVTVPGGKGKFQRMIGAVAGHTNTAIETMFDEATVELQRSIDDFILQIASKIHNMAEVINNSLDSIYLLSSHKKWVVLDPFMQKQIQDCRNQVLPELLQLKEGQNKAMTFLELEHKMPGKETGIMDTMSFEKDFQVD